MVDGKRESKLLISIVYMSIEKGANRIYSLMEDALKGKKGVLIGRNGTIELEALLFRFFKGSPVPSNIVRRLELHAGIFPSTEEYVDRWISQTNEAIQNTDILVAGWYAPLKELEEKYLNSVNRNVPKIPLRSLEPYYVPPNERWTRLLKGRKVAIINSFAKTAVQQTQKREDIWPLATESLLPEDVDWIPIVTGYAPVLAKGRAQWKGHIYNWEDAVSSVVEEVVSSGAEIALIGCGGLGMILGSQLKKRGVVCIVLGGAIQVLFGIKGERWATHDVIQHFWNDAWVYPSSDETPTGAILIEGACYWRKIESIDI